MEGEELLPLTSRVRSGGQPTEGESDCAIPVGFCGTEISNQRNRIGQLKGALVGVIVCIALHQVEHLVE
tara:strand:- start:1 stop:207 length:207 start_codon:yes stop_codon:yes gene_type:complete